MLKSYEASGKTVDEAIDAACALADASIENVEIEILELGSKGVFGIGRKDARVRVTVDKPEEGAARKPRRERKPRKPAAPAKEQAAAEEAAEPAAPRPAVQVVEMGADLDPELKTVRPVSSERKERGDRSRRDRRRNDRPARERDAEYEEALPEKEPVRRESHAADVTEGEMEQEVFTAARAFLEPIFSTMGAEPEYRTEIREGILWIILTGEKLGLLIGRRGETLNAIQYLVNLAVNKHRGEHVRIVLDVEGYRKSREETLTALAHKMADKAVRTGRRVELEPMNPHERRIVHIALQGDKRVETTSHGEEPYRRVVVTSRRRRRRGGARRQERPAEALPNVVIEHDIDEPQSNGDK